ncbi:MAG: phosphoribosylamine--glycine ligase [Bdellovibrionales bacterium]|nr:phosphoribosylamine--glycine ligase [Bdellovibrionales bacterium]
MKVLVVGGGGREHAIAWKLKQSPKVTHVYCAPGNAGTAEIATNVDIDPKNLGALAVWAAEHKIALTVVGPEAPLADGLADVFAEHGLKVFGPSKEAARLEYSKYFAKEVMLKAGVRTAEGACFTSAEEAKSYIKEKGAPIVVKADGLAAGKGVVVAETVEEALAAVDEMMVDQSMGDAGRTLVIEEKLQGKEASVMAIVDGETVLPMVVSQDYKRLLNDDAGPNTGGMGAVSPTSVLPDEKVAQMVEDIFIPVIRELWARGIRYTGFLYAGVMIDADGAVRVLEFNCRLGDPETQILMLRLQSDLFSALLAAVNGNLETVELKWTKDAAACVVASSRGYPKSVDDGKKIEGLFAPSERIVAFHAGTESGSEGEVVSKGGRILAVAALGSSVSAALDNAYANIKRISFDGMHYRTDIGRNN